ncbi:NAD-dependent dihydropyrimidine dehydrogenase subunit PreT [Posidoniimonas polymericola]|uniref:NAD-dependent dihydropyrimidine dehydrogenase subunit PreT n=1 Tax=Posidoniimonas polymericola TaxID=2528002 RepID=A0A5C5YMU3_9BACT|nr:2Fe-2S iron-sulfur cluster-binding protein [Posidoniimonas polymericola]TWT76159.1 NAD-dependent dihydropyrimidine dehydrogenase subunit PreT [Posidoniimonas polymericola]
MIQLWIDDARVEVDDNATVLDAARQLGIDVPSMCSLADHGPNTSCMCCLVRVDGAEGFVPSCATKVRDGMRVESETPEVHALRRTGIELLLADHAGDCHAPCQNTCPAKMDIPNMLRLVADGDYAAAVATVKREIALPAILGRVCPEVCEQACRRGQHDSPAAICKIKQFVADKDRASATPYRPSTAPDSGKRVAVIGAGPTGLTAVFHLRRLGHRCDLLDAESEPGGRLRTAFADELPIDVLRGEAQAVISLGVGTRFGDSVDLPGFLELSSRDYDAVLLATGRPRSADGDLPELAATKSGLKVDPATRMTSQSGVFAAGNAVRPYKLVVQSVAEGKLAADCINSWLRGAPPPDRRASYETRLAKLAGHEVCDYCAGTEPTVRADRQFLECDSPEEAAQREARRCLECDCRALASCLLHHYAAMYDCNALRYRGEGKRYQGRLMGERVTLEYGKCILCGICVQLAADDPEAVGLAVTGRGAETRINPPSGVSLDAALGGAVTECVAKCPTGALLLHGTL